MQAYRDLPIKWKLMFIIVLTSGIALFLACTTVMTFEWVQLPKEIAGDLATLAEMTAANSTAPLSFEDRPTAEETLQSLSAESHIIEASIYDRQGKVFASYSRGAKGLLAAELKPPGQYFEKDAVSVFRPVILD